MKVCELVRHCRVVAAPWPSLLCASLGMLAAGLLYGAARLPGLVDALVMAHPVLRVPFVKDDIFIMAGVVSRCGLAVAAICFVASLAGFVRRTWALRMVRAAICVYDWQWRHPCFGR